MKGYLVSSPVYYGDVLTFEAISCAFCVSLEANHTFKRKLSISSFNF